jgi:hypothetical protein
MVVQGADQLPYEELFEDTSTGLQGAGLGHPLAQFPDLLCAPERIQ